MTRPEAGTRPTRTEFIRESTVGQTPSDPAWLLFADEVENVEWRPDTAKEPHRGLGDVDPANFFRGPETHEVTVTYGLQQGIVDASDNPQDAVADGILRDSDNLLTNTHSLVQRQDITGIDAASTINGSTSLDTRIFVVAKGGKIGSVSLTGDPGESGPVTVEITYQFEKVREHQVDQPASSTTLDIMSSDANDTMGITVEDEGAATTETIAVNGTTAVTTVASFSDIDAIELAAEPAGDITISDGTNDLAVIRGSGSYGDIEGDLGIPLLGTGGHASALGSSYEQFLGDSVTRGGSDVADVISSTELTVEANLEQTAQHDSVRQLHSEGARDVELSANTVGETESAAQNEDHLLGTESGIVWTLTSTKITLTNAEMIEAPGKTVEAGGAVMGLDATFAAKGVTVTQP